MSDPVTNAEVEDVLSSIRRLVSEDKRPIQAPKTEPRNDRLVLTPALRVSDAADEVVDDAVEDTPRESAVSLGSLITDDTPLDVYGDDPAQFADVEEEADEAHLFDDPAQDYSDDPYNFDDEQDDDGELAEIHLSPEAIEDVTETAVEAAKEMAQEAVSETAALAPDFPEETAEDQSDVADEPSTAPAAAATVDSKAATLTAKIAALESAIGKISETWEPDDAGESDYAGTEPESMAWEDDQPKDAFPVPVFARAEARAEPSEPLPEPEHVTEQDTQPVEPQAAAIPALDVDNSLDNLDEEQLLDEDALRDLISEIVRSELQGALGERITRNVRKLVRREIHRALTAQELE